MSKWRLAMRAWLPGATSVLRPGCFSAQTKGLRRPIPQNSWGSPYLSHHVLPLMNASKPHWLPCRPRERILPQWAHYFGCVCLKNNDLKKEKPVYLMKLHEWCLQEQLLMETAVHVRPQRSEPHQVTAFDDAQAQRKEILRVRWWRIFTRTS